MMILRASSSSEVREDISPTPTGRRRFLVDATAALMLAGCGSLPRRPEQAPRRFDAIVAMDHPAGDGPAVFPSVSAAIAAAPRDRTRPFRIRITPGLWREKLLIETPGIHLVGDDRERCILYFDAAAGQRRPDGEAWGTWGCASITVRAPDFHARDLTIANRFDYLGHLAKPVLEAVGPNGAQAVALMLAAGSDRARLDAVDLVGHQDTLFVDAGRSLFTHCRISGSVDFVFGGGTAWFDACELLSRYRPGKPRQGYIAVPSTPQQQPHGLVFHRCRLLRETELPDASVALGRAWRPTRDFADGRYGDPAVQGNATFLDCWMDAHIDAAGWDPMAYTARDGSRVMLEPGQARFAEWRSRGPGAHVVATRPQLSDIEAQRMNARSVLGEWMNV